MKPRIPRPTLASLALVIAVTSGSAHATTYYWDNNNTTSGFGTAGGTWAAPTVDLWSTDSTGIASPGASITTNTADALYFGTDTLGLASGTITISGTVNAQSLFFGKASGAITLSGGSIGFVTGSATSVIQASSSLGSASVTHTINSDIAKTSGIIRMGTQNTSGENYIVNGIISGTARVENRVQNSNSYVAYNGLNSFTGRFDIITGQANANTIANSGVASSLGAGTSITMSGGTIQIAALWYTGNTAASTNRTINLSGGTNRIVSQDAALTLAGNITGTSETTQSALALTGDAGGGSNFNAISGVIGGNVKLEVNSFAPLGGSAEAGRWKLSGANTYTGTTTLNSGVLQADVADVAATSGALGNGGDITFSGGTLQYTANSAGADYSARIKSSASAMTFDTNGQNVTFAATLATSNTGGLTKAGSGTLTLSGANTYTGSTTVSGGQLVVNGSISASSLTTVQSGATLGGSGTIGALTVSTGGTLAPGNSPGNLTVSGGLTLAGIYSWDLVALSTASPGTDFDIVTVISGNVDITGASLGLNLGANAPSAVSFWQTDQTWAGILNNTGAGSLTGTFAAIDNSTWSSLGAFSTTNVGNDVNLVWTAIPEPSTLPLVSGLATLILLRRRRD
ncbi:MAG: autotransporter-associated beta strand repeat-containing protein [Akkermansiaceae bacterium]